MLSEDRLIEMRRARTPELYSEVSVIRSERNAANQHDPPRAN
jgi:hypothetical protein